MKTKNNIIEKASNSDTGAPEIKDFEASSSTCAQGNSMKSAEIRKNDKENLEETKIFENLVDIKIENSNSREKFNKFSHSKNSDTSTNIVDPLSEIDSQIEVELPAKSGDNSNEVLVFSKLFPNVSYEKLLQNEHFRLFSSHNGKNSTVSELYTNYLRLVEAIEGDFAKKTLVLLQNKLTSPGPLASSEKSEEIFFTKEQVLKMSAEQISKNYDTIRKSQQKW